LPYVSRKAAIIVGVLSVIVIAVVIDHRYVNRVHDANMQKAEHFKREFDQRFTAGARLEMIEEYLHSQPVTTQRELNRDNWVRELRVEVVSERSPEWGCWRGSAGVILEFVEERFQRSVLASWTSECLALPRF
jgi:hypothetical protein